MPNQQPRPEYVREIERASRHRTQDAFDILIHDLQTIPRHDLQQLLAIADPSATLGRRGISRHHAIKVATVIIRYVWPFLTLHSNVFSSFVRMYIFLVWGGALQANQQL